jgi:hypothetical protein
MKIRRLLSFLLLGCMTAPMLFACAPAKIPATIDVGNGYELPTTLVGTAAPNMGLPDELCNVSVTAKDSVGRTIPTNTSFSLRFNEPTSTETLKDHIFIYPESTLKIERLSDTEYTVTPENELDPGTVYRLSLGTDGKPHISFAFQTESRFSLSGSTLRALPKVRQRILPMPALTVQCRTELPAGKNLISPHATA